MTESFVKSRRGILEHLQQNKLTFSEFGVFELLLLLADKANGVVWTDSQKVASHFNGTLKERTAKDALATLKAKGYIKSFQQQGSRGSYPILINKYEITVGDLKGRLTNADQTVEWRQPAVSGGPDDVLDNRPEERPEERPPYSRPQDLKTSKPISQSNSAEQSGEEVRIDVKTGKPIPPPPPRPEVVKQIIKAYPMTPLNPAVERKWKLAIEVEIENMITNEHWADRDIAADWLLHQVKRYAEFRTAKQGWSLDKFMKDGHYDREWNPPVREHGVPDHPVSVDEKDYVSPDAGDTFKVEDVDDADGLS
jgi:hypothetical protein